MTTDPDDAEVVDATDENRFVIRGDGARGGARLPHQR